MKKIFPFILILFVTLSPAWGEGEDTAKPFHLSFEGGLGTAYNKYTSEKVTSMTGIINTAGFSSGFSNTPLYINISGIYGLYDNLSIVLTAADLFDLFLVDNNSLILNTFKLYPSIRYTAPFLEGLFFEAGWGLALLVPATKLSYSGGAEPGSTVHLSAIYRFSGSKGRIVPEAGLRLSRSELRESGISSIVLFFNMFLK